MCLPDKLDQVDDRMLGVNTMGVIKGTKVAMLHMAKRGGGVIINTASVAGLVCLPYVLPIMHANAPS